jgi:hypothetical protein
MNDCSCIYIDCGDGPTWYREAMVRPNTNQLRCRECGKFFSPLEKHERVILKWDFYPESRMYRTCTDCVSIRDAFFCEGYHYTRIWEDVWEHVCNTDGYIESSCFTSLTPGARNKLCDLIEKYWEDHPEEDDE